MTAVGTPLVRVDAHEKVSGTARYAVEHPADGVAYAWVVGATVAAGSVRTVDDAAALAHRGVLAVLTHANAPRVEEVDDGELLVLQSPAVAYRGQPVALVVAESLEAAREGAALLGVDYDEREHDAVLRTDHPDLYKPEQVNPALPADSVIGDADAALAAAAVTIDATYSTPAEHNNPMEPHATQAWWHDDGALTVYDSTQGASPTRDTLAEVFGLEPARVRVLAEHVGGGFGSKGTPRPNAVLAALGARVVGRPVRLAVTRQQMFAIVGHRTPTIQRLRLGADADGRLVAISHEAFSQTSKVREFAEQTATPTRIMYASPNRRTTHRLVALDVPTPSWMRAPGECPGMYALECAIDELAFAAGLDPIELRIRNEPDEDPEERVPFSSRNLVACLREGAQRFGWAGRDPQPGARRDGEWLIGTGVAAAVYPVNRSKAQASATAWPDGSFTVRIAAADIGTGARTVLTQIAADALGGIVPDRVAMAVGDSALPMGPVAGGSAGTASWGTAVVRACEALAAQLERRAEPVPESGVTAEADTTAEVEAQDDRSRNAFGAHFVEARVSTVTGEVRVPRMLGVFAAGRIINPRTARSQFIGGMTMGLSMALHEGGTLDPRFGDWVNHDLAQYHVAANADVQDIDAHWVDEHDGDLNPMGSKGIGEIGIVGSAAAVANAVHHACGVRVRDLPITLDKVLAGLAP